MLISEEIKKYPNHGYKEQKDSINKMVSGENHGELCYVVPLENTDMQKPQYSFEGDRELDICDFSALLYKELVNIKSRKWGHDHGVPKINPNVHGWEVIPQAFGSKYYASRPCGTIRMLNSLDDIAKLPEVTIYSQAFKNEYKIIEYFYNQTEGKIPIEMSYICGPFSSSGLIVEEIALLEGIYTNPEAVHWLMNKCTDLFIDFVKEQKKYAPNIVTMMEFWWPEGLGVFCGDDSIMHLSPKNFSEFVVPYYNRISDAFGGIILHSCGKYPHLFSTMRDEIRNLRGINFNAGDNACNIDKAFEVFKGTNTVLIPGSIIPGTVHNFKDRVDYVKYILKLKTPDHSVLFCSYPTIIAEPDHNATSKIVLDILEHYKKSGCIK